MEGSENKFNSVKNEAWRQSFDSLIQWSSHLEKGLAKKSEAVNAHLHDMAVLYGKEIPEKVTINLNYYPGQGNERGEPMSNLVEANRLDEELADVLYWVPNPNTFDPEDWDDRVAGVMQRVLHEVQHSSFQGTEYYEMLREAESDPTVQAVVASLGESGGEYIDVTNELITVYVEKLGAERMLEIEGESDRIPLVIEVDKVKHGEILEAVIREDVEKWRGRGPYSDLRQSWEDALGESFPDEGRINGADKVDDEDRSYMGVEIYQRAARLDTKMAREYISQGKPIDREFIIRLYQMLGELGAEVVESSEVIKN